MAEGDVANKPIDSGANALDNTDKPIRLSNEQTKQLARLIIICFKQCQEQSPT